MSASKACLRIDGPSGEDVVSCTLGWESCSLHLVNISGLNVLRQLTGVGLSGMPKQSIRILHSCVLPCHFRTSLRGPTSPDESLLDPGDARVASRVITSIILFTMANLKHFGIGQQDFKSFQVHNAELQVGCSRFERRSVA